MVIAQKYLLIIGKITLVGLGLTLSRCGFFLYNGDIKPKLIENKTKILSDFDGFYLPDTIYTVKPKVFVCTYKGVGEEISGNLEYWFNRNDVPKNGERYINGEEQLTKQYYATLRMFFGYYRRVRERNIEAKDYEYVSKCFEEYEHELRSQKLTKLLLQDTLVEILKKYNIKHLVFANIKEYVRSDGQYSNLKTRWGWYRVFVADANNKKIIYYNYAYGGHVVSAMELAAKNFFPEKESDLIEKAIRGYRNKLSKMIK